MGKNRDHSKFPNAITVLDNGNVGIGVSNPIAPLHIYSSNTNMASSAATSYTYAKFRIEPYFGSSVGVSFGLISPNVNYIQTSYNDGSSAPFTINPYGGYVGIGTSAPEGLLHIGSSAAAAVTTPTAIVMDGTYRSGADAFDKLKFYLYKSSTETYGFGLGGNADIQYWAGSSSDGKHRFFTGQSEKMRIAADGKVGIGISNPSFLLSVNSATDIWHLAVGDTSATGKMVRIGGYAGSGAYGVIGAYNGQNNGSPLSLVVQRDGGNFGIGLTNPQQKLHVAGGSDYNTMFSSDSNRAGWVIATPGTFSAAASALVLASDGSFRLGNASQYQIAMYTNNEVGIWGGGLERMRILNTGNIVVGTTASNITNYHTFAIARDGTFSNDVTYSHLAVCGVSDTRMRISMGYDTSSNYGYIVCGQLGVQWTGLYLQKASGAVYAGSARIDNNSDIRVKDNIQPINEALNKVLSMNGKTFHMVDEPENKIRMGFIAQELQGVVDELVIESDRTQKLPNGEVVENILGLETWGSSWAALLVESIKELKAEKDAEIANLKAILNNNGITI